MAQQDLTSIAAEHLARLRARPVRRWQPIHPATLQENIDGLLSLLQSVHRYPSRAGEIATTRVADVLEGVVGLWRFLPLNMFVEIFADGAVLMGRDDALIDISDPGAFERRAAWHQFLLLPSGVIPLADGPGVVALAEREVRGPLEAKGVLARENVVSALQSIVAERAANPLFSRPTSTTIPTPTPAAPVDPRRVDGEHVERRRRWGSRRVRVSQDVRSCMQESIWNRYSNRPLSPVAQVVLDALEITEDLPERLFFELFDDGAMVLGHGGAEPLAQETAALVHVCFLVVPAGVFRLAGAEQAREVGEEDDRVVGMGTELSARSVAEALSIMAGEG